MEKQGFTLNKEISKINPRYRKCDVYESNRLVFDPARLENEEQVEVAENGEFYQKNFFYIFPDKEETFEYTWYLGRIFFFHELKEDGISIEKDCETLVKAFLTLSEEEKKRVDLLSGRKSDLP